MSLPKEELEEMLDHLNPYPSIEIRVEYEALQDRFLIEFRRGNQKCSFCMSKYDWMQQPLNNTADVLEQIIEKANSYFSQTTRPPETEAFILWI